MRPQPDVVSLRWGDHHAPEAFERAPAPLVLIAADGRWMRANAALVRHVTHGARGVAPSPEQLRRTLLGAAGDPEDRHAAYDDAVRRLGAGELDHATITLHPLHPLHPLHRAGAREGTREHSARRELQLDRSIYIYIEI